MSQLTQNTALKPPDFLLPKPEFSKDIPGGMYVADRNHA
jgi:hypothetical protein